MSRGGAASGCPRIPRDQLVRRVLTAAGLSEAVTFGFIEAEAARSRSRRRRRSSLVGIANPLSAKFDTLRPSLLPGLVDAVAHNRRHGTARRRVSSRSARGSRSPAGETRGVALAWTGAATPEHWSGSASRGRFLRREGRRRAAVRRARRRRRGSSRRRLPFLVAGQAAVGRLAGDVADRRRRPARAGASSSSAARRDRTTIYVAELNLDRAGRASRATPHERVQPLPRHPSVVRDLSIVVADTLPAEIIRGTIQAAARQVPRRSWRSTFFDRYQGKGVPDGARQPLGAPDVPGRRIAR